MRVLSLARQVSNFYLIPLLMKKCLILDYPIEGTIRGFQKVMEHVGETASCPVVVVKFYDVLHMRKILVPLVSMEPLDEVHWHCPGPVKGWGTHHNLTATSSL